MSEAAGSHSSPHSQDAEQDFHKLMQICNSYGLDEEQTKQLMDQFRKGALFQRESKQAYSDSLDESQFQHQQLKEADEYSFQQNKNNVPSRKHSVDHDQHYDVRFREEQRSKYNSEPEKKDHQLINALKKQNEELRFRLSAAESQKQQMRRSWMKQSENVSGMKDAISDLIQSLKDKEKEYSQLMQKYTSLVQSCISKLSDSQQMSRSSDTQQMSRSGLKEVVVPQQSILSRQSNMSRQSLKHRESNRSSTAQLNKYHQQSNRQLQKQNNAPSRNKIDVKKYKGMIESIRRGMA